MGKEWEDPEKIPVDEIVEEWRSQSSRGRYESAMWRAAGLEEPGAKPMGSRGEADEEVANLQVDNTTAGGFFQRFGREPYGPHPTVIPAHIPAAQTATAAETAHIPAAETATAVES